VTSSSHTWSKTTMKFIIVIVISYMVYYGIIFIDKVSEVNFPSEFYAALRWIITVISISAVMYLLGDAATLYLRPSLRERAFTIGNLIKVIGFFLGVLVAFRFVKLEAEATLFGGAVVSLAVGLALQPVLGNLFAGLVILVTRYVEIGDVVRLISLNLPYQWASTPVYKFFSPDYVAPGYKGRIAEVGLLYTRVILDTGQELRVPNSVLLNSGVVDFTPKWGETSLVLIRVELPISIIEFGKLRSEIREVLSDFHVVTIEFTEQSDKDHVIVRIKLSIRNNEDWHDVKSNALEKLLEYRERKIHENFYKYSCLTRGIYCDKYVGEMSAYRSYIDPKNQT